MNRKTFIKSSLGGIVLVGAAVSPVLSFAQTFQEPEPLDLKLVTILRKKKDERNKIKDECVN